MKELTPYEKSNAIIPLTACKLAGIVVRGYQSYEGRSGRIQASSITFEGAPVAAFVQFGWSGSELSVNWHPLTEPKNAVDWKSKTSLKLHLSINDDGDYKLVLPEYVNPVETTPSDPIWQ